MSRRRIAKKRYIVPDPVFNEIRVAKFINVLMLKGKKMIAEKIVYKAIENAAKEVDTDPMELFKCVLENVRPMVEVRSRRVGGATYQVPIDVSEDRSFALGMRFIIHSTRRKLGSDMITSLSKEFVDAYGNKGDAVKMKEDRHKVAEANKAFSQFRW